MEKKIENLMANELTSKFQSFKNKQKEQANKWKEQRAKRNE